MDDLEAYHSLAFYTLSHPDPVFLHQYIVDAFAAGTATTETKPITIVFALAGLYLHVEKGNTGRQVQRAHMRMARRKDWPTLNLPAARGAMTVHDVLRFPPGPRRDAAIELWAASVWAAYAPLHHEVAALTEAALS